MMTNVIINKIDNVKLRTRIPFNAAFSPIVWFLKTRIIYKFIIYTQADVYHIWSWVYVCVSPPPLPPLLPSSPTSPHLHFLHLLQVFSYSPSSFSSSTTISCSSTSSTTSSTSFPPPLAPPPFTSLSFFTRGVLAITCPYKIV